MKKYNIEVESQELSAGNYKEAFVKVYVDDGLFWAGSLKISKTQLRTWQIQDGIDDDLRIVEVGKALTQLYLNKRILQQGILNGELDFIVSDRVGQQTFKIFLENIKNENILLANGRALKEWEVEKIWEWSKNDIKWLSSSLVESGIHFPSSGYSIFIFSLIDIWGSIMNGVFGKRGVHAGNIALVLKKLQNKFSETKYSFHKDEKNDLVNALRDNLVHNYGLRVLITNSETDYPNIDTDFNKPVIDRQKDNGRWHLNCIELGQDLLIIIEDWIRIEHPEILKNNDEKVS